MATIVGAIATSHTPPIGFAQTRNAQVLYSVAGQDEGKTEWEKDN